MTERPILFSAPMVRAILSGTKTQTRRIVKPVRRYEHNNVCRPDMAAEQHTVWWHGESERVGCLQVCSYGAPGDRLFVRETWRTALDLDRLSPLHIAEKCIDAGYPKPWAPLKYEADNVEVNRFGLRDLGDAWGKTRVSIHMPRWASRITLEVTGVRVERLQAITEEDAKAEGVERYDDDGVTYYGPLNRGHASATVAFQRLWDEINGKPRPMLDDDDEPVLDDNGRPRMVAPISWSSNPFVWVISFKRLEQP